MPERPLSTHSQQKQTTTGETSDMSSQKCVCNGCCAGRADESKRTNPLQVEQVSAGLPATVVPGILIHFRRALLVLVISSFLPVIVPSVPAFCSTILVVGLSLWVAAGTRITTEGFPEVPFRNLVLISFFIGRTENKSAKQTTVTFPWNTFKNLNTTIPQKQHLQNWKSAEDSFVSLSWSEHMTHYRVKQDIYQ